MIHSPTRQRGAIMIVTLLFLVILTMLGVTAMTGATMEERMAGNTRDAAVAFQAAEAALRDARRDVNNLPAPGASFGRGEAISASNFTEEGDIDELAGTCSDLLKYRGMCRPAKLPDNSSFSRAYGAVWPNTPQYNMKGPPSVAYGEMTGYAQIGGTGVNRLAAQPRYLIEIFCAQRPGKSIGEAGESDCVFYRILAAGYGRNPNTVVTLQEVVVEDPEKQTNP